MSNIDDVITADLAALHRDTTVALPDFASVAEELGTDSAGPYRDDKPGAEARRRALYDKRAIELALMPLASERIFVHRVSRAAAGGAAVLAVALLALASIDAWTQRLLYMLFGMPTAPLAAALLCCGTLAAYVLSGLIAEKYYERRMQGLLPASEDTQSDIDKLAALAPLDEARRLNDRVDAAAVALPLAGTIAAGLLLGLLVFFSDRGWSTITLIDAGRGPLIVALLAGGIASIILGRVCASDRRALEPSLLLRLAEHWGSLAAGGLAVIVALWYAARTAFGMHAFGIIPNQTTSLLLGGVGLVALLVPTAWAILWLRRREHQLLER